ncbi:MAG: HAD hydrolase-like protein [bacterium]|nr:HAD hydrolase-like protein [bacterium]
MTIRAVVFDWGPRVEAMEGAAAVLPVFQRPVTAIGAPAEATVSVGDDYRADVAGARRAGLKAIWLRPGGGGGPREIASLAELPRVLRQLEGGEP